jgi:hypothetical protein
VSRSIASSTARSSVSSSAPKQIRETGVGQLGENVALADRGIRQEAMQPIEWRHLESQISSIGLHKSSKGYGGGEGEPGRPLVPQIAQAVQLIP